VQAIETHFFGRGRRLLANWRTVHEEHNGKGSWQGPAPSSLGTHLLGGGCLLLTDTCNSARCSRKLLKEMVVAAVEASTGSQAWAALSNAERTARSRVYEGDCMQHLRNVVLDAMLAAATAHLKGELEESLDAFSSFERMSTDPMNLIRAVHKEFHPTGDYYKGKNDQFHDWRGRTHPSSFFFRLERAGSGRQDLGFDAALPIFLDRAILCEFLSLFVMLPDHSNILEAFLWAVLGCQEMVAFLRALTLFDLLLSRPWRWLAGSSSTLKRWSINKMGEVLDHVETALEEVADDGKKLLQPDFDPFASVAAEQPAFAAWRKESADATIKAPDGRRHRLMELALAEAQQPRDKVNKDATDTTIQLIEVMAEAALRKMRDPKLAVSDWLTSQDGKYAIGANAEMHEATIGAHTTTDRVESNFGCYGTQIRDVAQV